jgi:ATP-dependent helicase/DNAse subunit B
VALEARGRVGGVRQDGWPMPITLLTGPANAGKAELVLGAVRRHAARGQEPLLIVPRWADAEHYLRELAEDGAAMGVRVERFSALTEEVVRRAGLTRRPLGAIARERVIEALARESIPGAASSGLVAALGELISDLRQRRVAPARLRAALSAWAAEANGDGPVPAGLGRLYAAYDEALVRLGRPDAEQLALAALDELRVRPSLWGGTPVVLYGYDDLTPLQLDAIETLGRVVDAEVTVSLTYEPARAALASRAAAFQALKPIAREHLECPPRSEHYAPGARVALGHLERSLFEPGAGRVGAGGAVRLLEGSGQRAELELVAREIRLLLADGVAPHDVALVARTTAHSPELLEDVLTREGIPFAIERRRSFADAAVGRALVGLLRCVPRASAPTTDAEEGVLGDLLAWLRAPGLLRGAAGDEHGPSLADRLELAARRAGVGGAAGARALWEQRNWPLREIDWLAEAQAKGTGALLEQAERELARLFGLPREGRAALLDPRERDEARALAAGRRALAELRELARHGLAPADAWELASVLRRVELHSGERSGGHGKVAVVDPLALRARRVRALFLTGMQEGVFPAPARARGLLSEEERRDLAQASGLVLGAQIDPLAAERFLLYAVLSRPQELLVLSWHLRDEDGEPVARSLFVEDVRDLFDDALEVQTQERLTGAPEGVEDAARGAQTFAPDAPLTEPALLARVRERVWSASAIEQYLECPMRWYVERLLGPSLLEPEPEPFAKGGLAHVALSETLDGLRERTGSARVTSANLALARELLAASLEAGEAARPLSVAVERRLSARRRLEADLDRYLAFAAESDTEAEPEHLELAFGIGAEDERGEPSDLPPLELGGGLTVRGRIDRIDRTPDGEAVVIDYKSSLAPPAAKWLADGRIQIALYMRAAERLLDLRVGGGLYQPLAGRDLRARGAVECDSAAAPAAVRGDVMERAELEELVERAVSIAREAVERAGEGLLEPRPRTCNQGYGCPFPTICRCG